MRVVGAGVVMAVTGAARFFGSCRRSLQSGRRSGGVIVVVIVTMGAGMMQGAATRVVVAVVTDVASARTIMLDHRC